jgi:hypothetical protein
LFAEGANLTGFEPAAFDQHVIAWPPVDKASLRRPWSSAAAANVAAVGVEGTPSGNDIPGSVSDSL